MTTTTITIITAHGRTMIPATHIGSDYTAHVSVCKGWVAWRLNDARTGEMVLRGTEDFWHHAPRSFVRAARRAIRNVHQHGCITRVKPGDRAL